MWSGVGGVNIYFLPRRHSNNSQTQSHYICLIYRRVSFTKSPPVPALHSTRGLMLGA